MHLTHLLCCLLTGSFIAAHGANPGIVDLPGTGRGNTNSPGVVNPNPALTSLDRSFVQVNTANGLITSPTNLNGLRYEARWVISVMGDSRAATTNASAQGSNTWANIFAKKITLRQDRPRLGRFALEGSYAVNLPGAFSSQSGTMLQIGDERGLDIYDSGINDIGQGTIPLSIVQSLTNVAGLSRSLGKKTLFVMPSPNFNTMGNSTYSNNYINFVGLLLQHANSFDYIVRRDRIIRHQETVDGLHETVTGAELVAQEVIRALEGTSSEINELASRQTNYTFVAANDFQNNTTGVSYPLNHIFSSLGGAFYAGWGMKTSASATFESFWFPVTSRQIGSGRTNLFWRWLCVTTNAVTTSFTTGLFAFVPNGNLASVGPANSSSGLTIGTAGQTNVTYTSWFPIKPTTADEWAGQFTSGTGSIATSNPFWILGVEFRADPN